MKKIQITFSILFFLILVATTLLTVFIPDKAYSEIENKELTQKPQLSTEMVLSGKFQSELVDYLSDQFPLRESMIKLNTSLNKLIGIKNLNGAYAGKNGYYFEVVTNSDIDFERNLRNLNAIKYFSEKYPHVNVNTFLVPTASIIYDEYLPHGAEIYDADKLYNEAIEILGNDIFIELRKAFEENKEGSLFYKTDHHWTSYGAYIAYTEYCLKNGIVPRTEEDFNFEIITTDFLGTLHSKNLDTDATPDTIKIAQNIGDCKTYIKNSIIDIYHLNKLDKKDKYLVFFGDNYAETVIETECKNGKTLLVVKDSFANSFVPLLTKDFEKIVMIDQRYYTEKSFSPLMQKYGFTDVLFLYEVTNLSIQKDLASACKN